VEVFLIGYTYFYDVIRIVPCARKTLESISPDDKTTGAVPTVVLSAAAEVVVAVVVAAVAVTVVGPVVAVVVCLVFVVLGTVFTGPVKHNFYATAYEKFESG